MVVVTVIGPEEALAGTLNESTPGDTVLKLTAAPPPTVTSGCGDFSFSPEPNTVTNVFVAPKPGEKLEMLGRILKSVADWALPRIVPLGGETTIFPVGDPTGTVIRTVVLFEIVKSLTGTPPKVMPEQPMKLAPVRMTFVVARPEAGEKLLMLAWKKKFVAGLKTLEIVLKLCVPPSEDCRTIGPVAPAGAVTVIMLSLFLKYDAAAMPLNVTPFTPDVWKCTPLIVTGEPLAP